MGGSGGAHVGDVGIQLDWWEVSVLLFWFCFLVLKEGEGVVIRRRGEGDEVGE